MNFTSNQTGLHSYNLGQNNFTNATLSDISFSPVMDQVINVICIIILFDTMVALGCTMKFSEIKSHIKKPKAVVISFVVQFGVMPLTAFSLAKLFQLGPSAAMAVLVCGCCPGGMLSNVLAFAVKGDMNLRYVSALRISFLYYEASVQSKYQGWGLKASEREKNIVMTTCSTLGALGMIPLLLFIYLHGLPNLSAVPYLRIALTLIFILLPCFIGIYISYRFPKKSKLVLKIGLGVMVVSYIVLGSLLGVYLGPVIWVVTEPRILAIGALLPFIGYVLGYVLSFLFSFDEPCRRTVAIETGCQNLHLCYTILEVAFEREVIGPYTLFPFVYFFFQIVEALAFIVIYRCHKKPAYKPATNQSSGDL
ncbi:sodium/bile acid cotransporter [Silurus asotus]|uniref:Sodium/bile acid cotransporter n=1 Tax=Silurus asotus TaxID=30991 RepID=A0AAD5FFQ4_SILAS|nr:sodium/bile acid cotransporter [Silurus asotus]